MYEIRQSKHDGLGKVMMQVCVEALLTLYCDDPDWCRLFQSMSYRGVGMLVKPLHSWVRVHGNVVYLLVLINCKSCSTI